MSIITYLNEANVDYVFLTADKNIERSAVVDVLLMEKQYDVVLSDLKKHFDVDILKDICLYGLKKIFIVHDGCNDYVFFSRPSIKSVDKMQWVPLNRNVESYFWKSRVKMKGAFLLSDESLFFYLICKNVFNNRRNGFSKEDEVFIADNLNFLTDSRVDSFFRCTFYKFTDRLINLIQKKELDSIFEEYISFSEY